MSDLVERLLQDEIAFHDAIKAVLRPLLTADEADSLANEITKLARPTDPEITRLRSEVERLTRERDEARRELWYTGLAVGQIAKWPRFYFNRYYVEEWAIRTASILLRWKWPSWEAVLRVTSSHTKPNKRLKAAEDELRAANTLFNELKEKDDG